MLAIGALHLDALEADHAAVGDNAPRLRLFRTAAGNLWRIRPDLEAGLAAQLESIVRAEPTVEAFDSTPPNIEAYRIALDAASPVTREYRGPAFLFPEDLPPAPRAVVVTDRDDRSLSAHFEWATEEWGDIQPVTVAIEDGVGLAICHSPAVAGHAAEAGVFTAEVARGRGYAADVVAAWARAMRADGRLPMYSTSRDNAASRRVAVKLGLKLYGEDFNLA